ncbi:hypothetical protein PAMA_002815 [Pampus argenteus]
MGSKREVWERTYRGRKMHISVISSDGIPAFERCTTCCSQFHCPLCPKHLFKPNKPFRVRQHLEIHIKNAITFEAVALPYLFLKTVAMKLFRRSYQHLSSRRLLVDLSIPASSSWISPPDASSPAPPRVVLLTGVSAGEQLTIS